MRNSASAARSENADLEVGASGAAPDAPSVHEKARLGVVIASANRANLLWEAVDSCNRQEDSPPFFGVLSVPDELSLPAQVSDWRDWTIVTGTKGASAQRNAGIAALPTTVKYVFFLDDDTILATDYLKNLVNFLDAHREVVGVTGAVLLDGKRGDEIPYDVAVHELSRSNTTPQPESWRPVRELYGANFAIRKEAVHGEYFDERLPLYSWLEDHDLARRLMVRGALAQVDGCRCVHRAASSGGRKSHRRLGYSQVANPIYLWRKGSFPLWLAIQQAGRPVLKNLWRSLQGSEKDWRRRRLRGHLLALRDVLRRELAPERILEISET